MADAPKGRFTFRFAAVCFGLSAALEAWGLPGQVTLFGRVVGGAGAIIYHAVYVALFAWLAYALWVGVRSGYYVLLGTAVLYTVDRLQLLFVGDALPQLVRQQVVQSEAQLQQALEQLRPMFAANELAFVREQIVQNQALLQTAVQQLLTVAILFILLCWWGFVGYAWYRRDYFGINRKALAV